MPSRAQSITVEFKAWDTATNLPKPGDNANFTLRWIKDGTASAPTNASSEVDATNLPGVYKLTLTAAECTCDFGRLDGKSSTSGIVIIGSSVAFENLPTAAPNAAGGLITFGSGTGQFNPSNGNVTLAAAQGAYAPAKAGDAMTLTSAYDAAKTAASQSSVNAITTNTARGRIVTPSQMQRPATSSTVFEIELGIYSLQGQYEAPDALPTITVRDVAGTNLAANLGTVTAIGTGSYKVTYTVAAAHATGEVVFTASWAVGAVAFGIVGSSIVVDAYAVDFTSTDRTNLGTILGNYARRTDVMNADIVGAGGDNSLGATFAAMANNYNGDGGFRVVDLNGAALPTATALAAVQTAANAIKTVTDLLNGMFDNSTPRKFTVPALSNAPAGSGAGSGDGDTLVDHNTGGTDTYRCLDENSEGIDNMLLEAFLKTAYDADPSAAVVKATQYTGSDGRWKNPMRLNSGVQYVVVGSTNDLTQKFTITVP